jgi:hypothetical protein
MVRPAGLFLLEFSVDDAHTPVTFFVAGTRLSESLSCFFEINNLIQSTEIPIMVPSNVTAGSLEAPQHRIPCRGNTNCMRLYYSGMPIVLE